MTAWVQPRKPPCAEHPGTPTRTVQQRTFCLACESRRKQVYRDWQWIYRHYLQRCAARGIV